MLNNASKREKTSDSTPRLFLADNCNSSKKNKIESDEVEVRVGRPQFIFGKQGNSVNCVNGSYHFSLHPSKHLIVFCNSDSDRLIMYTLDGYYVTSISHSGIINPIGVAITEDLMYVTYDNLISSFMMQFSDFNDRKVKLCSSHGCEMWNPRGLECDHDGNVFFIDEFGHRVIMWSPDLVNYREIDLNGVCAEPVDLLIQSNQLILLSQSPPNITSISLSKNTFYASNLNEYLLHPSSFCPDGDGGMVIADSIPNVLKVFSSENKLTFIKLEMWIPTFARLNRIAMTRDYDLIILSEYSVHILST